MGGAHSNAGGGGERVLWTAIALMQRTEPDVISVVYSGDAGTSKEQIIAKAKVRCLPRPSPRARATFPPLPLAVAALLWGVARSAAPRRPGSISRLRRSRCTLSSSSRGGLSRIARGRGSR